jgi:hypothetical protein
MSYRCSNMSPQELACTHQFMGHHGLDIEQDAVLASKS